MSRAGVKVMSCCEKFEKRVAELEAQVAALDGRLLAVKAEGSVQANR